MDRPTRPVGKPFQLDLKRLLLGISVICGISAVAPFVGMVLAAYTPCLIGFLMLRHGAKTRHRELDFGLGVALLGAGFILGSLVLAVIANLAVPGI